MFKFFDKLRQNKQIKESVNNFKDLWETDFDDIWSIDIKNNLPTVDFHNSFITAAVILPMKPPSLCTDSSE